MLDIVLKRIVSSPVIIYIIRCCIGFLIGYKLYIEFPDFDLFWTLLSIILVISPEEKDTRRLSIERFKSNFIGSAVAMVLLLFLNPNVYSIILGIFLTVIVCRLFNVLNMARVALVALLIIMVQPHQVGFVEAPIYRFGSVAAGCIIGLLIVVFTSMIFRPLKRKFGIPY
ncbi:FUSC family protein [Sphingobacterium bovistauri]|uniref:FUSC family protein n=1 Tax=Sphingobacterium bovistauri TaxID=2781959 RepID=A0ABS7ZAC6_9SPHI|nr:FUSC family protein [Sphingobacterium bovistauri]MCA5005859.1 FUSC family protein [Sphingobacterium bovistauri]